MNLLVLTLFVLCVCFYVNTFDNARGETPYSR